MAYEEINPEFWEYKDEGDFIEGVLTQVKKDVGVNKSMRYTVENAEGVKNIWGTTVLDDRMSFLKIGDKIKITYQGKTDAKIGKNPAKLFKVERDTEE